MDRNDYTYLHRALLTDVPALGGVLPPVLDLATAPGWLWNAATDDYDEAALSAVLTTPGTSALWRSWRIRADDAADDSAVRVFVLEADDPGAAAATVRAALAGAGTDPVLLIDFATGDPVPESARGALASSALLWAIDAGEPVQLARVFDGVDPYVGPYFRLMHPRLEGPERDAVLGFLDSGWTLVVNPQMQQDILDPRSGPVVPASYRTDGTWIWTDTIAYYLREYGLAPDERLLAHARASGFVAAEAGTVGLHRALAGLFLPRDPTDEPLPRDPTDEPLPRDPTDEPLPRDPANEPRSLGAAVR